MLRKIISQLKNQLKSLSLFKGTVLRQRLTHFQSGQNLKNASIFGVSIFGVPLFDCIFRYFFGTKIDIYKFRGHFKNDFFTKLGEETIIFGQNQDFAVSIEQRSYSENDFDQEFVILTKLTKKFSNFENFENFQKMRQSLARHSLAKDCTEVMISHQ